MIIKIIDVSKKFGKNQVLTNINIELNGGYIYCLLGKNGAGKTTLFNLILDIIPTGSGEILILNKTSINLNKDDKRRIGVLDGDLILIEEISGYDFLKLIGRIYKIPDEVLEKRIRDLFEYFFYNELDLNKEISKYSTGMKKKMAFCASIIHVPEILILDEPFSGLDPISSNQLISFLIKYKREDRLILLSSHDINYVEKVATNIGVLENGKLIFDSTYKDFTENGLKTIDNALLSLLKPQNQNLDKINWI